MFRIDDPSAAITLPTPEAAGAEGYWTEGNPVTSTAATLVRASFLNMVQEELRAIVVAGGLAPSKTTYNQVLTAIQNLIEVRAGNYVLDTGVANAYVVALSPAIATYANGLVVRIKFANANTGASTLNAGGGVVPLVNDVGGALAAGDAPAGSVGVAVYDLAANKFFMTSLVPSQAITQTQADARYLQLAALNVLTAIGSQVQISADASPFCEGSQSTLLSGAAYALNGNIQIMKAWTHNTRIDTSGNFTGVGETGIATVMFWGEDDVLRTYTAPSVTAGAVPTFGALPTYTLDMKTGIIGPNMDAFPNFTAGVAANALTGTLAAPFQLNFRNATLGTGSPVAVAIGANLALTVPSTATLGTTNSVAARLVWLVAYNGGTPVLCVANLAGGLQLDETNLISPTTISAGATAANVIYSASAVGANSPYRVIGFTDITEATAGTWATAPSQVQPAGANALSAMGSLGYGQTWQVLTGSRAAGTTYYNTTGKPITVNVQLTSNATATAIITVTTPAGSVIIKGSSTNATAALGVSAVVPPGAAYVATADTGTPALQYWAELR